MTSLQALAERVAQGDVLREEDASALRASHDLIAVGTMADDVRRQMHGAATTFLRVFEVHLDAVPATLPQGLSAGEFRIVGRPASAKAAVAAVRQVRQLAAQGFLTGFSLDDLRDAQASSPDLFAQLREEGLDGIAEAPVDRWLPAAVESARGAGLAVTRLTVGAPASDPLALVRAARAAQMTLGRFRAFAPLPRAVSPASPTTGYDDVKLVALARLLVREIPSIQVDWRLYGPKLAQVALTFGADDVDGVAAVETAVLGARRSALEEIKGNIVAAGLDPVERDGTFGVRER